MTLLQLKWQLEELSNEQLACNAIVQFDVDGETVYKPLTLDTYRGSTFGGMIPENYPLLKAVDKR